jgi:hypothetical protein
MEVGEEVASDASSSAALVMEQNSGLLSLQEQAQY